MLKGARRGLSRIRLIWIGSIALALVFGALLGDFIAYATGVDHPVASKPIKVDYCFLFSHEDLFRGQPVETDAHYIQGIEGGGIGKDECPENDAVPFGPPENDPIGRQWEENLHRDFYTAEFDMSFVGVIPSYPRYRHWIADARNRWQPMHHVPYIQIQRLTHFQRTR